MSKTENFIDGESTSQTIDCMQGSTTIVNESSMELLPSTWNDRVIEGEKEDREEPIQQTTTLSYVPLPTTYNKVFECLDNFPNYQSNGNNYEVTFFAESLLSPEATNFSTKTGETLQDNQEIMSESQNKLPATYFDTNQSASTTVSAAISSKSAFSQPTTNTGNELSQQALQFPVKRMVQTNLPLTQSNFAEMKTLGVKSSIKSQKRSLGRSDKVVVQSNELFKLPTRPQEWSKIRTLKERVLNEKNQLNLNPTTSQAVKKVVPKKNMPLLKFRLPTRSKGQSKMQENRHSNSAPSTTTTLKRKGKENIAPIVRPKIRKLDKPAGTKITQVTSTHFSLPEISIERIGMSGGVKTRDACAGINLTIPAEKNSKEKSLSECLQLLKRNNVSVFKVHESSSKKELEKYKRFLEKNNVSLIPVKKPKQNLC